MRQYSTPHITNGGWREMVRRFSIAFLLLLLCLCLSGCAAIPSRVSLSVDARSSGDGYAAQGTKCVILPGMTGVTRTDLEYREYASYVSSGLETRGFVVVENPEEADIAVFMTYAISGPKTEVSTSAVPVFGQTGYSSSNTSGIYNANTGTYSGTTQYMPTYGVTGYQNVTNTYTRYTRLLLVDAFAIRKEAGSIGLGNQSWKVVAKSIGSSDDLRFILPILVAASQEYFGKDTKRAVEIEIAENDPRVKALKGE